MVLRRDSDDVDVVLITSVDYVQTQATAPDSTPAFTPATTTADATADATADSTQPEAAQGTDVVVDPNSVGDSSSSVLQSGDVNAVASPQNAVASSQNTVTSPLSAVAA
jgi:hypothetical protein